MADSPNWTSNCEMRSHILLALPLLAGPLAAQQRAIGPARSALFLPSTPPLAVADTGGAHYGMSAWEGALLGGLGGMLFGLGIAKVVESQNPCSCDDPGLDRAVSYGLTGLLVGAVVGGLLAKE